jgi:hypothetical protein
MAGWILVSGGAALMGLAVAMLGPWLGGKSQWLDGGAPDGRGPGKTDRQFINLYFLAFVIAPLLAGAVLIVFGLRELSLSAPR